MILIAAWLYEFAFTKSIFHLLHLQMYVLTSHPPSPRQILFSQMLICQPICLQEILKTNNAKYISPPNIILTTMKMLAVLLRKANVREEGGEGG